MSAALIDNPVSDMSEDQYAFRPYVEELHATVSSATSLPLTVGVFGPWGSGKSSFMRMWEHLLREDESTQTLWFNPWKYDQKIQVWGALVQSLLAEMQAHHDPSVAAKALRLAKTAAWLGLRSGLGAGAAAVTGGIFGPAQLNELLESTARSDAAYYRDINRFERDFSDAVSEFVGEGGRLVVFIDDLDRCTGEAAVNVLEALKLFLSDARCVFVLAMDFDLLSRVAASRVDSGASGSAYLEKIVQLPFFLPHVSFETLKRSLANDVGIMGDDDAFWDLVERGLGANPRRVKRFVNVFGLACAIAEREGQALNVPRKLQLAKLLIIRSEFRGLFNRLITHPSTLAELERSPALPQPGSGGAVELERERDEILRAFLVEPRLTDLLEARPGAYYEHPGAPSGAELSQMIRTSQLVLPAVEVKEVVS